MISDAKRIFLSGIITALDMSIISDNIDFDGFFFVFLQRQIKAAADCNQLLIHLPGRVEQQRELVFPQRQKFGDQPVASLTPGSRQEANCSNLVRDTVAEKITRPDRA